MNSTQTLRTDTASIFGFAVLLHIVCMTLLYFFSSHALKWSNAPDGYKRMRTGESNVAADKSNGHKDPTGRVFNLKLLQGLFEEVPTNAGVETGDVADNAATQRGSMGRVFNLRGFV
jgi:hypothetical protein